MLDAGQVARLAGSRRVTRAGPGEGIAIDGKKVDNPDDYKGEPLAGDPTDTHDLELTERGSGGVAEHSPGRPTESIA